MISLMEKLLNNLDVRGFVHKFCHGLKVSWLKYWREVKASLEGKETFYWHEDESESWRYMWTYPSSVSFIETFPSIEERKWKIFLTNRKKRKRSFWNLLDLIRH